MATATDNLPKPPGCVKLVYQDRLLTVNSPGCPLDEVLNAIHDATGIRFDGISGVAPRVVLRLGPVPPNLVVRQLFKDSPFDYFIMSENDAPKVVRIWRMPPTVVFERGLLTVQALDSTLAEVLETIRDRTGIQFEGATASRERVVVKLGPAPPVDVLNELFRGSHLNFVMLGQGDRSPADLRVILSSAQGPAPEGATTEPFVSAEAPQPDPPAPIRRGRMILVQPLPPDEPLAETPVAPPAGAESQQAPTLPGGGNFIVPPETGAPPPQQQTKPMRRGARPPE